MIQFPIFLNGPQEFENLWEEAPCLPYQPMQVSPTGSRTSSNGLWELSGKLGWKLGLQSLALYMHPATVNSWNTNATPLLGNPPASPKQNLRPGLIAGPGHTPQERRALSLLPCIPLHPEVAPAPHLWTHPSPRATKGKQQTPKQVVLLSSLIAPRNFDKCVLCF